MYEQIRSNKWRSFFLVTTFIILVLLMCIVFSQIADLGYAGVFLAVIITVIMTWSSYYYSDRIVLAMSHARPVKKEEYPYLYNVIEAISLAAGLPVPKMYVIEDSAPNAFATGRNPQNSAIAVTTGLIEKLDRAELEGVVAHEMAHIQNFDIRLMTLATVMVGIVTLLSDWMVRSYRWGGRRRDSDGGGAIALIFLVLGLVLMILAPLAATLIKMAISRRREYLADASGAMLTRFPEGLARALEKISADPEPLEAANKATAHLYITNPLLEHGGRVNNLFDTHPPIEERIKRLREMAFEVAPK